MLNLQLCGIPLNTRQLDMSFSSVVLVLPLVPCLIDAAAWIPSFAGPWLPYVDHLYECDEKEMDRSQGTFKFFVRTSHYNPTKPRELQIFNGNITLDGYKFGDQRWLVATADIRNNNAWKENAFVFKADRGACSFFRANMPTVWESFFHKKPNNKEVCELQPGTYKLDNLTFDWSFPNVPVFPYGHYRFTVRGGHPKRKMPAFLPAGCFVGEVHVVPKLKI